MDEPPAVVPRGSLSGANPSMPPHQRGLRETSLCPLGSSRWALPLAGDRELWMLSGLWLPQICVPSDETCNLSGLWGLPNSAGDASSAVASGPGRGVEDAFRLKMGGCGGRCPPGTPGTLPNRSLVWSVLPRSLGGQRCLAPCPRLGTPAGEVLVGNARHLEHSQA